MKKITKISSMLVLSTALSLTATSPAHALFGGGFSSAAIVAAVNKVKDSVLGGFNTLNMTNIMGFGQMTQNSQTEIAAEARMREAEQSLDRMRRIDEQKIRARDRSANTRMDCVIETRSRYIQGDVQNDTIISAETKDAMKQMAAIKLGMQLDASGAPKRADNPEEKATHTVVNLEGLISQSGPDALLASETVMLDSPSINDDNRQAYREACAAFAQVSDGSVRDNLEWAGQSENADSSTTKLGIFSDQMRGSLAQKTFLDACIRNDPKVFRDSSPDLHGKYLARANEIDQFNGLADGGISLNEARRIRGFEWIMKPEELDNLGSDAAYLKQLILLTGSQNVQNNELQETLDKTNMLLSGVLMSVNEQAVLTRKLLEK
ncbi:hypothetical protein [Sulfitobacter sp. R18_1]|uniref:hypothetical protein n=1 Tax=Sulfitobacter sp. R18_1 TaxID=2821104 RepID=UPI001ADC63AF|nr:hypothetical protein [Sulfitobacter sp. R18_1]MBO9428419.1 hypothetical protein [Sulfitobacter sp. R18_1]